MLSAVAALFLTTLLANAIVGSHKQRLCHSEGMWMGVFLFHLLFCGIYYAYAQANASDSKEYYHKIITNFRGETWLDFYQVGTPFVEFIGYPFVHYLGFGYEALMILFSFFGFLGFFYFYLAITKSLEFRHKLFGIDILVLLLFLPNMHFWTASLGKGSLMFMGLGILFYGLSDITKRWLPLLIGAFIVFHVRAHIMLVILVGTFVSVLFSSSGIKSWQKALLLVAVLAALAPVANTFLEYARIEDTDTETISDFVDHRSSELGKAGSSVAVSDYNQAFKLFTFLFRPLFIDAPNAMGLIVSFENVFYLILLIRLLSPNFIRYMASAPWLIKLSLIAFLGISLALAQVSGNLGLAIRQKSQVMFLFFFVVLAYADWMYKTQGKKVIGD